MPDSVFFWGAGQIGIVYFSSGANPAIMGDFSIVNTTPFPTASPE